MMDYFEVIKKMIADGNLSREIAEKHIPELKEDEKIKKFLIKHLELKIKNAEEQQISLGCDRSRLIETYKKAITWIEKQEQKWSEEDEKELKTLLNILHSNSHESFDEWLGSLKNRLI